MAVLTSAELATMRQSFVAKLATVTVTKPVINAALQAIEDTMISYTLIAGDAGKTVQTLVSQKIDAATQPLGVSFNAAEKKLLFALWSYNKYLKDKT